LRIGQDDKAGKRHFSFGVLPGLIKFQCVAR
jgi:hypothetical protein